MVLTEGVRVRTFEHGLMGPAETKQLESPSLEGAPISPYGFARGGFEGGMGF